jgi:hypothetical protein
MASTVETPSTVELVSVDDDTMTVTFDIGAGVTVSVTPVEDGFDLVFESHGETYTETVSRDFYESQQKRGRVGNTAARQLGQDPDWLKARLQQLGSLLEQAEQEMDHGLVTSAAKELMSRTERVLAFDEGDDATYRVQLAAPSGSSVDSPRWLSWSSTDDWLQMNAHGIREKHFGQFFEHVILSAEDIEPLREQWEEEMMRVPGGDSEEARILQTVLDELQSRLPGRVYDYRDPLAQEALNALYEEAGAHDLDHGGPVVWVQTSAIETVIEEKTSMTGTGNAREAIRPLRQHGVIVGDRKRRRVGGGKRRTVWPFASDELGIDADTDVVHEDDDPENDVPEP